MVYQYGTYIIQFLLHDDDDDDDDDLYVPFEEDDDDDADYAAMINAYLANLYSVEEDDDDDDEAPPSKRARMGGAWLVVQSWILCLASS